MHGRDPSSQQISSQATAQTVAKRGKSNYPMNSVKSKKISNNRSASYGREKSWKLELAEFKKANDLAATFDLGLSVTSYIAGWILLLGSAYYTSGLVEVAAIVLLAFSVVKVFTIQHDCGHDSYFSSQRLNKYVGRICSLLTFMPFHSWKAEHADHHAVFSNIDEPRFGDVLLLRKSQYDNMSELPKLLYRVFRHPLFMLCIAPFVYLFLRQRIPSKFDFKRVASSLTTTLSIVICYTAFAWHVSSASWLLSLLASYYLAATMGVVIFLVEHQFPESSWQTNAKWNFFAAATEGSSYFRLPALLEWYTGYIGYHHIHHLAPRIPSYKLANAFNRSKTTIPGKEIRFSQVLQSFNIGYFDDETGQLVPFRRVYATST
jgi:acyl-lipid omega-6 desaturase (Delta-12 desaturase)